MCNRIEEIFVKMRIYIIKHKGANIWQNTVTEQRIKINNEIEILAGYSFFRKKDALKYLKTFKYSEFFEVVGCTVDKTNADNRKKV
jgi:hypothetical protein